MTQPPSYPGSGNGDDDGDDKTHIAGQGGEQGPPPQTHQEYGRQYDDQQPGQYGQQPYPQQGYPQQHPSPYGPPNTVQPPAQPQNPRDPGNPGT